MFRLVFAIVAASATGIGAAASWAQGNYIGQIIMMGAPYCPRGSLPADGQLLPIAENAALFSILGTQFGGDGRTNFALPDLRGRFAMHAGQGPGLSARRVGDAGGAETATASAGPAPEPRERSPAIDRPYAAEPDDPTDNRTIAILNPYQVITFCVVTEGVYPSRS